MEELPKTLTKEVRKDLKKAKSFWHKLGPGLTTGASDDDPSGVATYSQTGAQTGFQFLWLALFTFPLMATVQEMCARIGLVTGRGLAANIRLHFPRWVLFLCTGLLFFANTINIGANLGAMAKAVELLVPYVPDAFAIIVFALCSLLFQIFMTYRDYAKYLKWLSLILLAYVFSALAVNLDWEAIIHGAFIPTISFSKEGLFLVTAILGTTISPYLFFWQTSQEVEEAILAGKTTIAMRREVSNRELHNMRLDVWAGMFLSNLVMFFIIAACAATLYVNGITEIKTAADAANALRPIAGEWSYFLFAVGIIGTGLLAMPVLAGSASYALSESFGWKNGLYRQWEQAHAFYGVIIASTCIGVLINFIGIDPIKALLYSAVVNGLVAPVILVLIIFLSSNRKVMGDRVNKPLIQWIGWCTVVLMTISGIATLVYLGT